MPTHIAKVTSKGQVTIPLEIRRELRIETGTTVAFDSDGAGHVTILPDEPPLHVLRRLFGTMPLPAGVTGTDLAARADEIGADEAIEHDRRAVGR